MYMSNQTIIGLLGVVIRNWENILVLVWMLKQ